MLGIIESCMPRAAAEEITSTPFSVLGFLRNFAIFRVFVDIAFYCGHRALHENKWLYQNVRGYNSQFTCVGIGYLAISFSFCFVQVHKRHHEHFTTNLRTNYHFTAPDLFVESAFPIFMGISMLRGVFGILLSR